MYSKFDRFIKERGIKVADVAEATGISKPTFSAWKKGDYTPKADGTFFDKFDRQHLHQLGNKRHRKGCYFI